jgi:NAD(P)H-dependent FMN reductase
MSLPQPVRCLVFAASLRHDSLNGRLATLAARTIEAYSGKIDSATMRDFDCPSYDGESRTPRVSHQAPNSCAADWRRPTPSSSPHPNTTSRCPGR